MNKKPIPEEIRRLADSNPVVHDVMAHFWSGEWTLEQAMMDAVIVLVRENDELRALVKQ